MKKRFRAIKGVMVDKKMNGEWTQRRVKSECLRVPEEDGVDGSLQHIGKGRCCHDASILHTNSFQRPNARSVGS